MDIGFIPIAEAATSVATLMKSINKVVINPLILFLFAVAMVYFLYGLVQYFLSPDNEEVRKTSKSHMIWGVVGLFIMVAVFGIERLILGTVGETKIKIQNTGDYEISQGTLNTSETPLTAPAQNIFVENDQSTSGGTVNVTPNLPPIVGESPLKVPPEILAAAVSDDLYYRNFGSGVKKSLLDAKVLAVSNAKIRLANDKEARSVDAVKFAEIVKELGKPTDDGMYHYFVAMQYPKEIISGQSTLPIPEDMRSYKTDSSYYRAVDSGANRDLATAKMIAIRNARVRIGAEKGATSLSAINYTIIKERAFKTPDGLMHYFVAISHPR